MNRRRFLGSALGCLVSARVLPAQDGWRTFDVSTRVELPPASGVVRLWLPLAHAGGASYQRVIKQSWKGNSRTLRAVRDERTGTGVLYAEWPHGDPKPDVELTLTIATRDRVTNWFIPTIPRDTGEAIDRYTRATKSIPLARVVRDTAWQLTSRETHDVGRARAIYEWVVENVVYDPSGPGCGTGDATAMLTSRNLRGQSADIAALFVALARAAGVPARDVWGIHVGSSRRIDGAGAAGDLTRAQYCRAEFFSARHGWVPVDPADAHRAVSHARQNPSARAAAAHVRRQLFGSWEMNWIAFNAAREVQLPGSAQGPMAFFVYPEADFEGKRLDPLAPAAFQYEISARQT